MPRKHAIGGRWFPKIPENSDFIDRPTLARSPHRDPPEPTIDPPRHIGVGI